MSNSPFAMFITWTSYGTWLPGDPRGHVSNTLGADGAFAPRRNQRGTLYWRGDRRTLAAARRIQKRDTVWLNSDQAVTAAEALVKAAKEREWLIIRAAIMAAIMANHLHTLTTGCPDDGPAIRRIFKGVTSAELSNKAGNPGRWWMHGGSDRYLHDQRAIDAVERYIREQQGILCEIVKMQVIPRQ